MNISIKKRIYTSFSLMVVLFIINGVATVVTLNKNKQLSQSISEVIDPSLQTMEDFEDILVQSKMYSTNWVFLRSNQQDHAALIKLHSKDFPALKLKLDGLFLKLNNPAMT